MHPTSMNNMRFFRDKYLKDYTGKIVEVGSYDVNGSYRDLWPNNEHLGIDIKPGPNVDMVLDEPYLWPIESNSVDVIISGSTLEHIEYPEKVMSEITRTLKRGAYCCIIAPSAGPRHDYPEDFHRFTVESMTKLAHDVGLDVIECSVGIRPPWKDVYMVTRKGEPTCNIP